MDTGDEVLHKPTGETWTVAYVDGDRLVWCGHPEGLARVCDCVLLKKASSEYRANLLRALSRMPGCDGRKTYAVNKLNESKEKYGSEKGNG